MAVVCDKCPSNVPRSIVALIELESFTGGMYASSRNYIPRLRLYLRTPPNAPKGGNPVVSCFWQRCFCSVSTASVLDSDECGNYIHTFLVLCFVVELGGID